MLVNNFHWYLKWTSALPIYFFIVVNNEHFLQRNTLQMKMCYAGMIYRENSEYIHLHKADESKYNKVQKNKRSYRSLMGDKHLQNVTQPKRVHCKQIQISLISLIHKKCCAPKFQPCARWTRSKWSRPLMQHLTDYYLL